MLIVNARFLTQKITGVQRYAIEICIQLKKIKPQIIFVSPKNILEEEVASKLGVVKIGTSNGHRWEQVDLPLYLKKQGSPLLLNLCNTAPVFYKNKITVIHDLAFERYPQSFSWQFRYFYKLLIPKIAKRSHFIITDSEFSKKEIHNLYGINYSDINVVPCAISSNFKKVDCKIDENYLLAVSSLNYHKNFHSLIKAFNELEDSNVVSLYIIGGINKNFAKKELLEDIEKNPKIKFLGYVSDEDLLSYYSNALGFVYPSLYEGFGLPPLEAQACGCPCLVSNVASLPEVYQDSVLYCDPNNIFDIEEKLKELITNEDLRNDLSLKGFLNIKRFTWIKSAEKILELVDRVL